MEKFEIKPENLKSFIKKIRLNENFRAMAVTMPYKKEILKYLDNFDSFAKKITMGGKEQQRPALTISLQNIMIIPRHESPSEHFSLGSLDGFVISKLLEVKGL